MTREFTVSDGMALSVFRDKYARRKGDGSYQTWKERVEEMVAGNLALAPGYDSDKAKRFRELAVAGVIPLSGRHLQHGDLAQPTRQAEYLYNCTTAMFSWASFLLLMKGCGVGRDYSSDMCFVDWDYLPECRFVLAGPDKNGKGGHPDYEPWIETLDEARHKYDAESEGVRWFEVEDSGEGWAKIVMIMETAAFHKHNRETIFVFDLSTVRPRGAAVMGQQGRPASGPVPLIRALTQVMSLRGAGMKPWKQALFVDHFMAACVVVGGVRRAARIAVKSCYDRDVIEFIDVKRGGYLWSANNSISVDKPFWERARDPRPSHERRVFEAAVASSYWDDTGEPGFLNIDMLNDYREALYEVAVDTYLSQSFIERIGGLHRRTRGMIAYHLERAKKRKYVYIVNPCFTGDTLIWTSQGHKSFAELASSGKDVNVLTLNAAGRFVYRVMKNPRKTGVNRELVRIHLRTRGPKDRRSSVRCTPDHEFFLRDGTRIAAKALVRGMRISSVYRHERGKGYLGLNNHNTSIMEHHVPFENVDGLGILVDAHHLDGNKHNNKPDNLELKSHAKHSSDHISGDNNPMRKWFGSLAEEEKQKLRDKMSIATSGELNGMYGRKHSLESKRITSMKAKERYLDPEYREKIRAATVAGMARMTPEARSRNHEVVSIEFLSEQEDVYCGTVDETHSFFISLGEHDGVLVKNCGEIPLAVWGGYCDVGDICLANAKDEDEAIDAAGLVAAALVRVNTMDCIYGAETRRTNRIGVSLTGIHEFAWRRHKLGFRDLINAHVSVFWDVIEKMRLAAEAAANEESDRLGLRHPATYTCVKPSGTVSKVLICTEGAHLPAHRHYVRWVAMLADDLKVEKLRSHGYPVKDISHQYAGTVVVGFPTCLPLTEEMPLAFSVTASEATPTEQYRWIQLIEKHWMGSDDRNGQVSYTLKWNKSEISYEEYMRLVLDYQPTVRCCALMPELEQDGSAYAYVPEEPVSEDRYRELMDGIMPIEEESYDADALSCEGGACPIEEDIR